MQNKSYSAVIFTALPVEFNAVRSHLHDIQETVHNRGTVYEIGTFTSSTCTWRVALVQIGMGNPRASFEVERAISFLSPSHVFFVGVAGGLKDVHMGDVVAATKVYAYEVGKADIEFKPRFDFAGSSYAMVQRAQAVARHGVCMIGPKN